MQSLFRNKKLLLLSLVYLMVSCFVKKNNAQQELISATDLKEDFDILRTTLEQAHPGLYWYSDTHTVNSYFDSVKALIDQDLNRIEFFNILLPVIANVNSLHTTLRLQTNTNAAANQFTHILPFDLFC